MVALAILAGGLGRKPRSFRLTCLLVTAGMSLCEFTLGPHHNAKTRYGRPISTLTLLYDDCPLKSTSGTNVFLKSFAMQRVSDSVLLESAQPSSEVRHEVLWNNISPRVLLQHTTTMTDTAALPFQDGSG